MRQAFSSTHFFIIQSFQKAITLIAFFVFFYSIFSINSTEVYAAGSCKSTSVYGTYQCSSYAGYYGIPANATVGTASFVQDSCTGAITYTGGCSAPCTENPVYGTYQCSSYAGYYGIPSNATIGTATFTQNSCTGTVTYTGGCSSDTTPPTATVVYSTASIANNDVTVAIFPSEDVTITNNGGSTFYTFTSNGAFTFYFVDNAGNNGSVTAVVSNIDKNPPTATVSYNTLSLTNNSVIATINPSEQITVTNNGGSTSHTFTTNGSFTFTFVDLAGNTGSVIASISNIINTYTISSSAGANGTLSPQGNTSVNHGGSQTYTITPQAGYSISSVVVDGVNQGAISSYTFSNVTSGHSISATFSVNTYTISSSAGANGTLSPQGNTSVNHGGSQTYTITPQAGYSI
ncbi:MAG: hypothetical protein KBC41_03435, partial [Candidatus Pacebacteria bacterium]|nr:hypothetical protein [Candidatus Paceibacterota bacterium]